MDFTVLVDHGIKIKENEKRAKYLDPARELKNEPNLNVTVTPIVVCALGTVLQVLEKGPDKLELRRIDTIQTIVLQRLARILRNILKIGGNLQLLWFL